MVLRGHYKTVVVKGIYYGATAAAAPPLQTGRWPPPHTVALGGHPSSHVQSFLPLQIRCFTISITTLYMLPLPTHTHNSMETSLSSTIALYGFISHFRGFNPYAAGG